MKYLFVVLFVMFTVALAGSQRLYAEASDIAGRLVAQEDSFDATDDTIDVGESGELDVNIDEPFDFDPEQPFSDEDAEAAAKGIMAVLAGMLAIVAVVGVIAFIVAIFVYYLFYTCAASIPEEHQQVAPGMVFLMLIPCVNFIVGFLVFPKIAAGFKSYFDAQGRTDVGDAGQQLGLFLAICFPCCLIPYLGAVAGIAGLVLAIILLVKFMGYKNEILAAGGA